jgi:hypothetical protein
MRKSTYLQHTAVIPDNYLDYVKQRAVSQPTKDQVNEK